MSLDDKTNELARMNPFEDTSDVAQALDRMDSTGNDTEGLSKIDMNAVLNRDEIRFCLIIDELTRLGILEGNTLTKMFKRLSVSTANSKYPAGVGRTQKVQLFQGIEGSKQASGLGGLFTKRE